MTIKERFRRFLRQRMDKSEIMRRAWVLRRADPSRDFGDCLRESWAIERTLVAKNIAVARMIADNDNAISRVAA